MEYLFSVLNKLKSTLFFIVGVLLFLVVGTAQVNAATYYSRATGNWNSNTTWSTTSGGSAVGSGVYPVAGDVVYIERGYTVTVTANAACASVTFRAPTTATNLGALSVNTNVTLTVSGAVTMSKPANTAVTANITGAGTLNCASLNVGDALTSPTGNNTPRTHTLTSTISALNIAGNLNINSYSTGNRMRNGVFTHTSGTVTVNGSVTTTNANTNNASTFTLGNSSPTLVVASATPFTISGTGTNNITFNGTGSTVVYNYAGAQTVRPTTYQNLTLSGSGLKTVTGVIVNGNLLMAGSASITPIANTSVGGATTLSNSSSITLGTADVLSPTPIVLDGGTLSTGSTTGYNETVGTLGLTNNSTIALGTGNHTLIFSASNGVTWPGTMLTVTGWTGILGTSGTAGKIRVGTTATGLTATQLGKIQFSVSGNMYPAMLLGTGELVPYSNATITTGTISPTSFCPGSGVSVPFTITGTFVSGNVFTAQLSNASGSFASPVNIGTLTSTSAGTIAAAIPFGTVPGTGYRIRVVSSNAVKTGTTNTVNLTVTASPAAPTVTGGLICIGSTATLSASGAASGNRYRWYDAASGGNILKTSTDNADNTFTTPVLGATTNYWVAVLSSTGCESARTQVTATFPAASADNQNDAGANTWIGHVYDGTNFNTYYGRYTESETFNQSFGGATNCFAITSNGTSRSIHTETFSVRYRMNSTRKGLFVVDMGSDDGGRLTVDGTLLYNNWTDQAFTSRPRVLMSLTGSSSLVYDFYENGGQNQAVFQNITPVLANNLTSNTNQSVLIGSSALAIGGDVYGTLPTGISLSGTGYQWTYSTTPGGARTNITGATGATFTPNTTVAPFNVEGTYYIYRNAVLSSSNNVAPNPYVATNESNAATFVVRRPLISVSPVSLSGFSYPFDSGPSNQQSFTVSGSDLSTNIVITPSPSFEISTTGGSSFVATSPINLSVSGGNVNPTTIYVRLKAGLEKGSYTGENIALTSTAAITKNVTCSGIVNEEPTINVSPVTLSGFSYTFTAGPSTQQAFSVSGVYLVSDVTVTPPTGYEISTTSGTGFVSTPILLTPSGGTLSSRTIYVRLKAGLGVGNHVESIVVSSVSADERTITCSGTVSPAPTLIASTASLAGFVYASGLGPSAQQSFVLTGSNLTSNVTVTPPANFAISTTSGSGFTTSALSLTPASGSINRTIYVQMVSGLSAGNYGPVNVSLTATGAVVKTVALSGSVVSGATIMTSKSTLTGFGYMQGNGPSSPQSVTVSGVALGANITVTPPANYEISQSSGSGYQSTAITLTQSGGVVSPTTIYVRLKAGLTAGNYPAANITLVSSGATTKNISCAGVVFISPLITAGGGGNYCAGLNISLTSTGDEILNRFWQGPNGFYSVAQNPVISNATPAMSGTYSVTGNVVVGGNLVVNGDFEAGNTSFGSSYGYVTPSASALQPEALYTVVANPRSVHGNFSACPDHTIGGATPTGMQMVVNGAPTAGVVVWSQNVPVIPGADYEFSYWVQTVVATSPSQLQLYVNGVAAGPTYTAETATCLWKQFVYNTNAGSNSMLNLELINQNTVANGNDFALDDIVFQQILSAISSVNVTVNPVLPVSVSVTASSNPVLSGTPVTFTANPINGGDTPSYQWKVNGQNVGTSSTTYIYVPKNGDVVQCVLTSSYPCTTNNPATSNNVSMTVIQRDNFWMGTIDTDWGKPGNWTADYVPLAGDDVEYATEANFGIAAIRDLHLDTDRTIGNLINATTRRLVIPTKKGLFVNNYITTDGNPDRIHIKSSATEANGSLIFNNPQDMPVSATVEMYSKAYWNLDAPQGSRYKWQYFGIPLRSVKANPTFTGSYVRKWYETGTTIANHWIQLDNESVLEPFHGYEVCQENPKTIIFRGELVNSNFESGQLSYTSEALNPGNGALYPGQHIFANPYTAAIDIRQLTFGSQTEATVFMYNTGSFAQWNGPDEDGFGSRLTGIGPGQYMSVPVETAGYPGIPVQVPSMQAMLVKAMSYSPNAFFNVNYSSVVMNNEELQRVSSQSSAKNTDKTCTVIDVKGSKLKDRMWLISAPGCSRNFDNGWDGVKMLGSSLSPQLFAMESDGLYQVNSVKDINNTVLGFQAGQDVEYTLTFTHENTDRLYAGIYLVDLVENRVVDVTLTGSEYTFLAESTPKPVERFKIVTRYYEKGGSDESSNVKIFSGNKSVYIQNTGDESGELLLYDISGRFVDKVKFSPKGVTAAFTNLKPSAYVVKAITANERVSERLIVR